MKPYKAEFFKRDFTLRAAAGIQSPELVFDYLTTEKTEITLPGAVKIARGDWAHVSRRCDGYGNGQNHNRERGPANVNF